MKTYEIKMTVYPLGNTSLRPREPYVIVTADNPTQAREEARRRVNPYGEHTVKCGRLRLACVQIA